VRADPFAKRRVHHLLKLATYKTVKTKTYKTVTYKTVKAKTCKTVTYKTVKAKTVKAARKRKGEVAVRADPFAERWVHHLLKLATHKTVKPNVRQSAAHIRQSASHIRQSAAESGSICRTPGT